MVAPTDSTDEHGCGIYKSVIIRGICGRINIKLQMVAPIDSTDAHGCGIDKSVIIHGICGRINIKLQMVSPTDSTDEHGCGIYKSVIIRSICGRTISSYRWWLPQIARMHTDVGYINLLSMLISKYFDHYFHFNL